MKTAAAQPANLSASAANLPVSVGWALACLSLSLLLASLGTSIANVALPTLVETFAATFQQVQWVVLIYLLVNTCLIVSMGRLGDIIGRKRLLMIGLAIFTLASGFCGMAQNLSWLIAARAVQGSGAAIMMALALAMVGEFLPKDQTGRAMGLLGTMSAVGTALGPSLGGVLIAQFGWSSIFFVMVPMGIAALVLARHVLPAAALSPNQMHSGFDHWGTLLLAATLAAYALAMTMGRGHFGAVNIMLLGAALVGIVAFVLFEMKVSAPLVDISALGNIALSSSLITNLIVATVVSATLVVGPFYLSRGLGLDAALVGLVMSVGPILSIFSGVVAGRLVDGKGTGFMALAGLAAMTVGVIALALLPSIFGVPAYVGAIAVFAPGYQLFQAANNTSVMVVVRPEKRGALSGLLNLSRNLGLITGASLMGAVFAFFSASSGTIAENQTAGFRATFLLATALMVIALAIAAWAGCQSANLKPIARSGSSPGGQTKS